MTREKPARPPRKALAPAAPATAERFIEKRSIVSRKAEKRVPAKEFWATVKAALKK